MVPLIFSKIYKKHGKHILRKSEQAARKSEVKGRRVAPGFSQTNHVSICNFYDKLADRN